MDTCAPQTHLTPVDVPPGMNMLTAGRHYTPSELSKLPPGIVVRIGGHRYASEGEQITILTPGDIEQGKLTCGYDPTEEPLIMLTIVSSIKDPDGNTFLEGVVTHILPKETI